MELQTALPGLLHPLDLNLVFCGATQSEIRYYVVATEWSQEVANATGGPPKDAAQQKTCSKG